ncbi:MAG: hypothetical protein IT374_18020 [Polyangiaceae bacterium]|nr:hypothetical protein [Polyangiaceae bacterium]
MTLGLSAVACGGGEDAVETPGGTAGTNNGKAGSGGSKAGSGGSSAGQGGSKAGSGGSTAGSGGSKAGSGGAGGSKAGAGGAGGSKAGAGGATGGSGGSKAGAGGATGGSGGSKAGAGGSTAGAGGSTAGAGGSTAGAGGSTAGAGGTSGGQGGVGGSQGGAAGTGGTIGGQGGALNPKCGDGTVDLGEECDLGAGNNGDDKACTSACKSAICGDGLTLSGTEECDLGVGNNGDDKACTAACKSAKCGDGLVRTGAEECDLGAGTGDDQACTTQCKSASCGDGLVGPGEECDLGAGNNGDDKACTAACKNAFCGDGLKGPGEGCDDGPNNGNGNACTSQCVSASCGDGFVQAGVEDCDDGANNGDDKACTSQCKTASCGDGLVLAGTEECDAGASNSNTGACTLACKNAICSDGFIQAGVETCDDGGTDLGDGCNATCQYCSEPGFALDSATGTCYRYIAASATVDQAGARAQCVATAAGWGLFTPSTQAEMTAFYAGFPGATTWTGGGDVAVEGLYRWEDGSPFTYSNGVAPWNAGEPNNLGDEDAIHVYGSGLMNDLSAANAGASLPGCERNPTSCAEVKTILGAPADGTYTITTGGLTFPTYCAFAGGDAPVATSCNELHTARPDLKSGHFLLDVDGAGAEPAFYAYCDMEFDGGGWTLIGSYGNSQAPDSLGGAFGSTGAGTTSALPLSTIQLIAPLQLHVRSTGNTTTEYMTSKPNTLAVANLVGGKLINAGYAGDANFIADFGGPGTWVVDHARYDQTCVDSSSSAWPHLFWGCNFGQSLHVLGSRSTWIWNVGGNTPMQVYVR